MSTGSHLITFFRQSAMRNLAVNIYSLFEQIADDNPKAFQRFFDCAHAKLYSYARYFIGDNELCKDIISDVYLCIWQNRKKLTDIQDYENFLFVCIKNKSLNYLKHLSISQKVKLDAISLPYELNPEQHFLNNELQSVIDLSIRSLPHRCRLIFAMVREKGLSYKRVAGILSISERTVHAQMCIALKRIAGAVQEYRLS
jgi:RNA polymerase sigma-70 factor (ECF subfamily)